MELKQSQQEHQGELPWDGITLKPLAPDNASHNQLANEARKNVLTAFLGNQETRTIQSVELLSAPECGEEEIFTRPITVKHVAALTVLGNLRRNTGGAWLRKVEIKKGFCIWLSQRTDDLSQADLEITIDGDVAGNITIFRPDDVIMSLLQNRDNH